MPTANSDAPTVRTACHDLSSDEPRSPEWILLSSNAVVLIEGVFLHRAELRDSWDFSVFLRTRFDVTVPRAVLRDGGDPEEVRTRYEQRYVPGQRLYLSESHPEEVATWVVDHDDPQNPEVVRA